MQKHVLFLLSSHSNSSERDSYSSDESVNTFLANHKMSSTKSDRFSLPNENGRRLVKFYFLNLVFKVLVFKAVKLIFDIPQNFDSSENMSFDAEKNV